ncbi:helix-turn-helix domain-containing protein [Kocuria rhizophila]|nr:helix-turn-helix transcriptional regulator [Kocuria rhizophila]MCR4525662.1 helix-turn-helix domain-containing protein [Kocuria rhizophila]MCT1917740.1 helix-turn-helix domain-containing protein [Kocuria rhizophila]
MRELRTQRGYSQKRLADELTARGVELDTSAVSRMEKGTRALRLSEAMAVADVLSTTLDQMIVTDRGNSSVREALALVKQFDDNLNTLEREITRAVDSQIMAPEVRERLSSVIESGLIEGMARGRATYLQMRLTEISETDLDTFAREAVRKQKTFYGADDDAD